MKRLSVTIFSLVILATWGITAAFAANPVLFFSDLSSAPNSGWEGSATKGAAVSIYGLNFGSAGSVVATVNIATNFETTQIGDSDANYMVEWGATTNNPKLDARTTLQRITFYLNSSISADATATISVTVDGTTSNTIPFGVRNIGSNHIWFINASSASQNGSTKTTGYHTIQQCDPEENGSMFAGDVVYIADGIYSNIDGDGAALKLYGSKDGTSSAPYAFVGYPGESPVFTVPIQTDVTPSDRGSQIHFYTFAKLKYSGNQTGLFHFYGDGWRIINIYMDMSQCSSQFKSGTFKDWWGDSHKFYGNVFKGGGYDYYAHHIYGTCGYASSSGGNTTNIYIAWNEVDNWENDVATYDGGAAWNFRKNTTGAYTISGIYIHDNYMHDSAAAQFYYQEEPGTSNVYIYNNIGSNNNTLGTSSAVDFVFAGFGSSGQKIYVYNNTFYECGAKDAVIKAGTGCDIISKNNIFYESTGDYLTCNNSKSSAASDHDIFYGNGAESSSSGVTLANSRNNVDPLFTNAGSEDFTLKANSPAIDGGISDVSNIVTVDILGTSRPKNSIYDLGAYEYIGLPSGGGGGTGETIPPAPSIRIVQ